MRKKFNINFNCFVKRFDALTIVHPRLNMMCLAGRSVVARERRCWEGHRGQTTALRRIMQTTVRTLRWSAVCNAPGMAPPRPNCCCTHRMCAKLVGVCETGALDRRMRARNRWLTYRRVLVHIITFKCCALVYIEVGFGPHMWGVWELRSLVGVCKALGV